MIIGGLLMAAGHLMMTIESAFGFFTALALLICGNGFFKPNISTIVGTLYPAGSRKRDGGFTIFYMGINLGAAMSPLLCGYIGETYGWHWGFGLATIGMLAGVAVFVAPTRLTQLLILIGALAAAIGLVVYRPESLLATGINIFVAVSLLVAGAIAVTALGRGGLAAEAALRPTGSCFAAESSGRFRPSGPYTWEPPRRSRFSPCSSPVLHPDAGQSSLDDCSRFGD